MFVTGTANDGLLDPISAVCTKLFDIRAAAVKLRLRRDATPRPKVQETQPAAFCFCFNVLVEISLFEARVTSLVVVSPEDVSFLRKGSLYVG